MNLHALTAHALLDLFKSGKASAKEAYEACFNRIKAVDPKVKAYVHLSHGQPSYAGEFQIPIAIKDNLCTKGEEITCASRILKGFRSPYDAGVIERVKKSGGSQQDEEHEKNEPHPQKPFSLPSHKIEHYKFGAESQ